MKKPAFGQDTFCLEAMNFEPGPIHPSRPLRFAKGAMGSGCGVVLAVRGRRNAISTHAPISSCTVSLLWLSGVN